jgi:cytochrome c biogenesis protein CcmG, thiol:disulfide interchange protein DsbE
VKQAPALLLLALGCSHGPPPTPAPGPGGGEATVSALTLASYPKGSPHAFAEDQGQVVVIDAWATWCAPCERSLPLLHTLQQRFAAQGLRTYAVSIDAGQGDIPGFLKRTPITLPILLDPEGSALETVLGLRLMPTTWVIDRAGKVRARHEGFQGDLAALQADVERVLAEAH